MNSIGDTLSPEIILLQARVAELETALRNSEDRTRLLLDSTAEAIYGIDPAGRCMFANAACARLLGYQHEGELLGQDMHALVHHSRPDASSYAVEDCLIMRVLKTGQGVHVDDEVLWRVDGSSVPIEYWAYPIRENDRLTGVVVTFLDITERRRTDESLRRYAREMAALYHISLELNSQSDLTPLLRLIVEKAAELLDARMDQGSRETGSYRCMGSHYRESPL